MDAGKALKERLAALEGRLAAAEDALQLEAQRLPNLTHPDVPVGGEDAAVTLDVVGQKRCVDWTLMCPVVCSVVAHTSMTGSAVTWAALQCRPFMNDMCLVEGFRYTTRIVCTF